MNETKIEWSDFTSNPIRFHDETGRVVWGCVKTSSGCANCYAEQIAKRWNKGGPFTISTMNKLTPFLDGGEIYALRHSEKIKGKKIFLGDMTDVFGEWIEDSMLDELFVDLKRRSDAVIQILTKRAERLPVYMRRCVDRITGELPNVWLGVSVENQKLADERIPHLLRTPAAVRFLSCEPLLGPVDLRLEEYESPGWYEYRKNLLHWVIVGGESGAGSRACNIAWIRSIVEQCKAAGVACFVKQFGTHVEATDAIDPIDQFPNDAIPKFSQGNGISTARIHLKTYKGGDPGEWPMDLRVREFPKC